MLVVGFTGHSGSGKTTLIEKVLEALISRDRKVSAIKSSLNAPITVPILMCRARTVIAFVKPGLRK